MPLVSVTQTAQRVPVPWPVRILQDWPHRATLTALRDEASWKSPLLTESYGSDAGDNRSKHGVDPHSATVAEKTEDSVIMELWPVVEACWAAVLSTKDKWTDHVANRSRICAVASIVALKAPRDANSLIVRVLETT